MRPQLYSSGFLVFRKSHENLGLPQQRTTLEFLLMQHEERWDLPKGHLDLGESKKQAAIRELAEETGIQENAIQMDPDFVFTSQYWVNYDGERRLKELTVYLALLIRGSEITPTEHLGFRWFPFAPPHSIQSETIDPLLEKVAVHFESHPWAEG
ncbi:MAG: bis(5'-nucleosyl)-tetraphosphatase [Pirellula sp.]|jgi:8-oxo-dGTP pyrophosphatase MutT (NUDIX family)